MTLPLHPPDMGPDAFHDALAVSLRHAGDVSLLLQGGPQRWTDALLSEVRAHLSGCLNAVEMGFGLLMEGDWLARSVEALGPGYCRLAVERHPAVLSPALIDHLRLRAAAATVMRMGLAWPPAAESDIAPETSLPDGPLSDAVTALRLSVDPWFDAQPLDRAMRADLPAEVYCDLVWAAAALIVEALTARMGVDNAAAVPALARAAETLIARHDEQAGPFARAASLSSVARDAAEANALAEQAVLRHDLLLFAALGSARANLTVEQSVGLLVDGEPEERAALARLLNLSDVAYVAMLDALAPVQDAPDDSLLPDIMARYRELSTEEAQGKLSRWRGPPPLVARLARMGWARP